MFSHRRSKSPDGYSGDLLSGAGALEDAPHAVLSRASGILTDAWAGVPVVYLPPVSELQIAENAAKQLRTSPYTSGKGEANENDLSAAAGGAALVSSATPAKSMERSDNPCRKKWKTGQSPDYQREQVHGRLLKAAVSKYLAHRKEVKAQKSRDHPEEHGGQVSMAELQAQKGDLRRLDISDPSLKEFDRIARQHEVKYSVFKLGKGKYQVFFKAPSEEAMMAAFEKIQRQKAGKGQPPLCAETPEPVQGAGEKRGDGPDEEKELER